MNRTLTALVCTCAALSSELLGQAVTPIRPPSVPLVTSDPYFSIWSSADTLAGAPTTHWTGKPHRLTSLVRIDGRTFRLMGGSLGELPAMKQSNLAVYPTQTVYEFEDAGIHLTLTFTSPMLPDDLSLLARPVTYVTYTVRAADGKPHDVALYFDAGAEIATNLPEQKVLTSLGSIGSLSVLKVGTEDQNVLTTKGDDHRIDWGHFYVAADSTHARAAVAPADAARGAFAQDRPVAGTGRTDAIAATEAGVLSLTMSLGRVEAAPVARHLILAYDDEYSIKYFRENLRPYWRKDGADAAWLLKTSAAEYEALMERCAAFDAELVADLERIGGPSYVQIGVLAWRQALAAQKICADANGQPLSFSKENFSNGCIATVDVLYPAAPQMLVFAPSLLKASLVPILDYASSPRWKFDSAPHDLGQYPHATGQVYGGEDSSPMPVEESGNMLIMMAALARTEGNADLAEKYWPTLTLWYNYLKNHGLDPANQLCTDDFAGHFARNANLSVKAIMGMASYGMLADMLGKKDEAQAATDLARQYARRWMALADGGDHYQLVFGDEGKGTWSQKYNLVWDKLLKLDIFPPDVARREIAFYRSKMNVYGLPLDSRRDYTKLDWQLWTATMADSDEDFRRIVDACAKWARETPARVPMTDWYDTRNGKQSGFQARSVVGGLFIGLMRDEAVWKKYSSRDRQKLGGWAEIPWQLPPMKRIVAAADTSPAVWRYTVDAPAGEWMTESYDDSSWRSGQSGFGAQGTPGAVIHTEWKSDEIYLRRDFELSGDVLNDPQLLIHHDDDVVVYINGVLALKSNGFITSYTPRQMTKAAKAALRKGRNIIAVHCRQQHGGQYIDVGLVDVLPIKK